MSWELIVPVFLVLTKVLLAIVALIFLVSGVDDLFIDVYYAVRQLYRRFFVMRRHLPLTEEQLRMPPEKPLAIMVPAWDESVVIGRMLENLLRTTDYANYHVFVGTYPNDPKTSEEVERVRATCDNVHLVVCPKDGPTNKADCLNWVYQGVLLFERESGTKFEIFVIHDSEDIVHPLSLKLFNYIIPRKDMVQLPVFPLESPWHDFTAGHYLDEFAENHTKDLLVRERLSGSIPSAGVGCAFGREALMALAAENDNQLFSIDSLTEDYEIGFRLQKLERSGIFVRHAIERTTTRRSLSGRPYEARVEEFIATREAFPRTLSAAVRQKARWVIGIALQGWGMIGWSGRPSVVYMLYRDRKALITAQANVLGYVTLAIVLSYGLVAWNFPEAYRYPPLVEMGSWLWWVIVADTVLLGIRLVQRVWAVRRIYGWEQAVLAIPRVFWANVINFLATGRAIGLFGRYLVTGKLIAWDKTAHVFPSEDELRQFRRRLGDLLVTRRFITLEELERALERQKRVHRPLGAVLVEMGLVGEDDLVQVLGAQLQLSSRELDPYATPIELLRLVPREVAVRHSVYPVEMLRGGRLLLATDQPLRPEDVTALGSEVEVPIELCLSTRSDVAFAIRRGYERLDRVDEGEKGLPRLGEILLRHGLVNEEQLREALKAQRRSYVRLGDVLVQEGILSAETFDQAFQAYLDNRTGPLGAYLVQHEHIAVDQLELALALQGARVPKLGEILVANGAVSREDLESVYREADA